MSGPIKWSEAEGAEGLRLASSGLTGPEVYLILMGQRCDALAAALQDMLNEARHSGIDAKVIASALAALNAVGLTP